MSHRQLSVNKKVLIFAPFLFIYREMGIISGASCPTPISSDSVKWAPKGNRAPLGGAWVLLCRQNFSGAEV
jgi:hypothetical protein